MSWLDGRKTYLAALLAALVAFGRVSGFLTPEVQEAVLALATALGLVGLRHALQKLEPISAERGE